MNTIKRLAGIIWLAVGAAAGYYLLINQAIPKFGTGKPEDLIPAGIYTFILCPLIVGSLATFGIYALKGEYDSKS
ncbi:hypothetical protein DR864_12470 [Runella rosea]|jgi:hypothetical protein|uniref:Uncharacterized protein n=3 Tax=Runella TaxID=105 RepID=A0A344TIN9_9BACT|nr:MULTISPECIES: hypothetical protein [Runella]AXE18510.1 hypothetical protein DR864_12470 [Runella rosea]MCP1381733.1 hypothetical protein [Runella salmonicolor]NBB18364.1 hypothetical protein [Runella sp. CRIBMP]RDB07304.1 hypothetical protein DVG78_04645 [Runella aurantiaca]